MDGVNRRTTIPDGWMHVTMVMTLNPNNQQAHVLKVYSLSPRQWTFGSTCTFMYSAYMCLLTCIYMYKHVCVFVFQGQ